MIVDIFTIIRSIFIIISQDLNSVEFINFRRFIISTAVITNSIILVFTIVTSLRTTIVVTLTTISLIVAIVVIIVAIIAIINFEDFITITIIILTIIAKD